MSRTRTRFFAASTAEEVVDGIDLRGRRAIVTGGAAGVGLETSRALARAGAEVTLAVRRTDEGDAAARTISGAAGTGTVLVGALDLSDQASVASFVDRWDGPLDLLVNNAGVMALPSLERTPEGWETQFAVNHLGHFALAVGLHDALAAAPEARVVAVSLSGHHISPVVFDDIHFERRAYDPWSAYGQSKTASVLFAIEATRRWTDDGITVNAVMPGGIMTELQRHLPGELRAQWAEIPTNKTPAQGAATSLVAAVAPELAGVGGRYLEDGNEAEVLDDDAETDGVHGVRRWALDPEQAERLWQVSSAAVSGARVRSR